MHAIPRLLAGLGLTLLIACGGGGGGTTAPTGGGSNPPPTTRTVTTLATRTASPLTVRVSSGDLFWAEASITPLNKVAVTGGAAVPLVRYMGDPEGLTVAGGFLYWLDVGGTGYLTKSSLDGTTHTLLAPVSRSASGCTNALVVDASSLYWVGSAASPNTYTIYSVPLTGGTPMALASTTSPIVGLTGDGTNLYWEELRYPDPSGPSSKVRSVARTGGAVTDLATGLRLLPGGLQASGGTLYFAEADYSGNTWIRKVPTTGGAAIQLAQLTGDFPAAATLRTDGTNVYWAATGGIWSVPVAGGTAVNLAVPVNPPADLCLAGGRLIWAEHSGRMPSPAATGRIASMPVAGGTVTTLLQGGDAPYQLASNGTALFWSVVFNAPNPASPSGRIGTMTLDGSGAAALIEGIGSGAGGFELDATNLYVYDGWRIKAVPRSGGLPRVLCNTGDRVTGVATDGTRAFWVQQLGQVYSVPVGGGTGTFLGAGGTGPTGPIAAVSGQVYWLDHNDSVYRIPVAGGTVATVARSLPYSSNMVVDGVRVYLAEQDAGALVSVPVGGGTPTTLATVRAGQLLGLATDGISLSWIDQSTVSAVPVGGGAVTTYRTETTPLTNAFTPASVALDSTSIYWSEPGTGKLQKATPR